MRDAYEVLKQKEADLARVRHEVESLRIVARALTDLDSDQSDKTEGEKTEDYLLNIVRKTRARIFENALSWFDIGLAAERRRLESVCAAEVYGLPRILLSTSSAATSPE